MTVENALNLTLTFPSTIFNVQNAETVRFAIHQNSLKNNCFVGRIQILTKWEW